MPKLPPEFELKIEKLVFGGEGLGYFSSSENTKPKPIFVAGVLPEEVVRVRPIKVRGKFAKAKVVEIVKTSQSRREPREPSHLSTSPWQILSEAEQLQWKKDLTLEMWQHTVGELPRENVEIIPSPESWGYRNKLEYSVVGSLGKLQLAFRERGQYYRRVTCQAGSALAPKRMNEAALLTLSELNHQKFPAEKIKNLLVRYSFAEQKTFVGLFITEQKIKQFDLPEELVSGFLIAYSDPERSQSVVTRVLHQQGSLELTEKVGGVELHYGFESFFQVNPPAFDLLLTELRKQVKFEKRLIDLYSGVGTIGLALANRFQSIVAVESNPEAVKFARKNARNIPVGYEVVDGPSEKQNLVKICRGIPSDRLEVTVIVDPPRAGLHPRVIQQLLEAAPSQLVYISCNPATQARDFALLKAKYTASHWQLFDFYPQTPHLESLLILEKSPS